MITSLPTAPNRATDTPQQFSDKMDALLTQLVNQTVSEMNSEIVSLNGKIGLSMVYTFSSTTTAADPGSGVLRLNNATQASATAAYVDLVDANGVTMTTLIDTFDDSTSVHKGFLRLQHAEDLTKWLIFNVTAVTSPSGYKTITLTPAASSATNPFANGDRLVVSFTRTGDIATGTVSSADVQNQQYTFVTTAGTGTAYTATLNPAMTSYAAGKRFCVVFHAAAAAAATINVNGLGAISLLKAQPDGSYASIEAGDWAASWRSDILIINSTQAVVMHMPPKVRTATATSAIGTFIDFLNIPPGIRKLTIMFNGVSTNGSAQPLIQLGDSGGIENTGYNARSVALSDAAAVAAESYTVGFGVWSKASANVLHGSIAFDLLDAATNTWVASGSLAFSNGNSMVLVAGSKGLSATLDRLRITTFNGTDSYDAGTLNISYE